LSRFLYNLVFWVFLLPFLGVDVGTAFALFTVVLAFRATANLWHNNGMEQTPEAYDRQWVRFPI